MGLRRPPRFAAIPFPGILRFDANPGKNRARLCTIVERPVSYTSGTSSREVQDLAAMEGVEPGQDVRPPSNKAHFRGEKAMSRRRPLELPSPWSPPMNPTSDDRFHAVMKEF